MYWWWPAIIDPQLGLSKEDQRHVFVVAWAQWIDRPRNAAVYTCLILVLVAGAVGGRLALRLWAPGAAWHHDVLWLVLVAVGLGSLVLVFRQRTLAPLMYQELRRKGYDVCKRCGYVLGGLDPCPECGTKHKECA